MSAPDVAALRRANARLAALAASRGLAFLDPARPPIATPSGALAEDASADEFHLDARGYAALARWIAEEGGPVGALLAP